MRILRFILASVVVIFTIVTIISLFIPSHVRISRGIQINCSKDSVMKQLSDVSGWKKWYPGADTLKLYYVGNVERGLVLDEQRKRYLVLKEKRNDQVTAEYLLPNKKIPTGWLVATNAESNSVTIQWYMDFHLRWYPWEKFYGIMAADVKGPLMQQSLDKLKKILEAE